MAEEGVGGLEEGVAVEVEGLETVAPGEETHCELEDTAEQGANVLQLLEVPAVLD